MAVRSVPDPPEGYLEPYEYPEVTALLEYATTSAGRRTLALQLLVLTGAVVLVPTDFAAVSAVVDRYAGGSELRKPVVVVGGFYGLHLATAFAHENVHRAVERSLGYDTEVRYGFPASYAFAEEQMIKRGHNLLSLALPFVAISTTTYLVSAAATNQVPTVVFGVVFLLNAVYSTGDVRGLLFLATKPRRTKAWVVVDGDSPRTFIYEPEGNDLPA
jgi:hypothetical protein